MLFRSLLAATLASPVGIQGSLYYHVTTKALIRSPSGSPMLAVTRRTFTYEPDLRACVFRIIVRRLLKHITLCIALDDLPFKRGQAIPFVRECIGS